MNSTLRQLALDIRVLADRVSEERRLHTKDTRMNYILTLACDALHAIARALEGHGS